MNDGNGHFIHKEKSKQLFLDFIDEPIESERRIPNRPIFTTYSFGDSYSNATVRIILLDVRYNKSSYVHDNSEDMLGQEQWIWFEDILRTSNETFTLIVSPTQILPFNRLITEAWYGESRKKLFSIIGKLKKSGVILITGDIHEGEILKTFCVIEDIGYSLYEFTSSGLSHYDHDRFLMEYLLPNDYNIIQVTSYYNYGKIEFIWGRTREESKIKLSLIDIDNITRGELVLSYSDLVYDKKRITDLYCSDKINRRFKTLNEYYIYYSTNKLQILIKVFLGSILFTIFYIAYIIVNLVVRFIKKLLGYLTKSKIKIN